MVLIWGLSCSVVRWWLVLNSRWQGIFLSLRPLGVSPWGLDWASSQHGCIKIVGLFHGSSEFQSTGESYSDL